MFDNSDTDNPENCDGGEGEYIGCFVDDPNRDLKQGPHQYNFNQKTCNTACKGYTYYSLQNGDGVQGWCACGNGFSTMPQYAKKPDSECGGPRGFGKAWRNSIYKTCEGTFNTHFCSSCSFI